MKEQILLLESKGFTSAEIEAIVKPFAEYWFGKGIESVKVRTERPKFDEDGQYKYDVMRHKYKGEYHEDMDDYHTNRW